MKLLTSLPSILGKISDLVGRSVTSDLEITQVADFPIIIMPFPLRASPALGVSTVLKESSSTIAQITLTNGATVANVLYTLGRGVWDIYLSGDYEANYAALQLGGEVQLKNPANATMAILLSLFPFIGHLHFENVRRITLDDDTTNIQVVLGLNGAAQTHSIRLGVVLDKLL